MSLPYFPMYPKDFEADTSHLTLEEDGAYNRLLRLVWMSPGCSLPDDDAWIMRRMRVDADTYERVVRVVLDEFFTRKSGRVSNARIAREYATSNEAHAKRVSAGKKGGEAKALKTLGTASSNARAMPKQPEPEPLRGDTYVSPCSVDRGPTFDQFWASWPLQKQGKENARKAFAKLSASQKSAATEQSSGWCASWRTAHPQASDIHPATYLNNKRWEDEAPTQPPFKVIHGRANERSQFDTAHREYTRRLRSGEINRGPDPSDPFAG